MPQRLTELLTAIGDLEDPSVRVQVTADAGGSAREPLPAIRRLSL